MRHALALRAYSSENGAVGKLDCVRFVHICLSKSLGKINSAKLLPGLAVIGALKGVDRALLKRFIARMKFLAKEEKLATKEKEISERLDECERIKKSQLDILEKLSGLSLSIYNNVNELESRLRIAKSEKNIAVQADVFNNTIIPVMESLRADVDSAEKITSADFWPYPSYGELLFGI